MEFNFTKSQLETLQKLVEYPDDFKYPLGTIIASDDPDAIKGKGGLWEQITDKFLLGAGSTFAVNSTGGEINHKLTIDEMPSHSHTQQTATRNDGSTAYSVEPEQYKAGWWTKYSGGSTLETGGSKAHNNMPPYMAKYMWIKTKLQSELEGGNV